MLTKKQLLEVEGEIQAKGLTATLEWVKEIAVLTKYGSGMFGVPFKELIAYLNWRVGETNVNS